MTQLTNEDQKISDMAMNFEVRANLDAAQDALNRALKELRAPLTEMRLTMK